MEIKVNSVNEPNFVEFTVKNKLPKKLQRLDELAHNLLWVWSVDVKNLFKSIDEDLWTDTKHNPLSMLEKARSERWKELEKDTKFLADLDRVYDMYKEYMAEKYNDKVPSVAYFSMEYGLTDHLRIYSGGLGVLAGDYLKEASDQKRHVGKQRWQNRMQS